MLHDSSAEAPSETGNLTPQQGVRLWLDLMNVCDGLLRAGLRREIGPDGDLRAAYQAWYDEQMRQHDETVFHMLSELSRRSYGDAG